MEIKRSIFVDIRTWRDAYNQSYFASWIYADGKLVAVSPFQYGSNHESEAEKALAGLGITFESFTPYILEKQGIDLYTSKTEAKYFDLKRWAKAGEAILESREILSGISAAETVEA